MRNVQSVLPPITTALISAITTAIKIATAIRKISLASSRKTHTVRSL